MLGLMFSCSVRIYGKVRGFRFFFFFFIFFEFFRLCISFGTSSKPFPNNFFFPRKNYFPVK